jgi:hypothetical protein
MKCLVHECQEMFFPNLLGMRWIGGGELIDESMPDNNLSCPSIVGGMTGVGLRDR